MITPVVLRIGTFCFCKDTAKTPGVTLRESAISITEMFHILMAHYIYLLNTLDAPPAS